LLVTASLLPSVATAASPDEMTVDQAVKLLKSHEMFSATWTVKLNTGTIHASRADVEHYQPKYTAFKARG